MVYDKISNIEKYKGMSEQLDKAIDFLCNTDLGELPLGKTVISEDKVFANVMEAEAREEALIAYEIHKKYMDIQIDIEGTEIIKIGAGENETIDAYREDIDFGTVSCKESAVCIMGKGNFIICMGEEPHKPGIASQEDVLLKKCVIKVAVK